MHFSNPLGFQEKESSKEDNVNTVKYVSSHGDKKASFVSEKSCNRFQMHGIEERKKVL